MSIHKILSLNQYGGDCAAWLKKAGDWEEVLVKECRLHPGHMQLSAKSNGGAHRRLGCIHGRSTSVKVQCCN